MTSATLGGWGRFPVARCQVFRPERRAGVAGTLAAKAAPTFIARGLGRSYGDAALNAGAGVVVHDRLDRMRGFDPATGVLDCEAGVSVADIIDTWHPRGWFPSVTPGTKFVTVGGAIAADVHGKNHHGDGTLANVLESLTLLTADGEALHCSRTEHADVFWATVGGLGLTGMILDARMRLRRVESSWLRVDYRRARDLDATLATFEAADATARYSVAWIDCLGRGRAMGRAVIMHGDHATAAEATAAGRTPLTARRAGALAVPFDMPGALLSPLSVRLFNAAYYAAHRDGARLVHFERFFYPLDGIAQWNRLYGRRGFAQYQVALPPEAGERGLVALLERLSGSGRPSFLAVLKRFGPQGPGVLSFPREGYTLALDLPVRPGLVEFLADLDRLVLAHGGRVYLAKDATTTAKAVRAMYPRLDEFRAIKARLDPRGVLSSSLARRLGLVA
ncbi:MAG: FAD-binding oxidoreductase [Candidatus Rokubacteria bacterium]|nr:FAD-binding oxidoreductase [Candidatus Rokubacteria bacterium]